MTTDALSSHHFSSFERQATLERVSFSLVANHRTTTELLNLQMQSPYLQPCGSNIESKLHWQYAGEIEALYDAIRQKKGL